MRSDYVDNDTIGHLLWAMTNTNRLVCEVALQTGWRIDDVLAIRSEQVESAAHQKRPTITITEKKTGKRSTRALPKELVTDLLNQSGRLYCFEGRDDWRKPRTRQAVYLDIRRVAKRFGIKSRLTPHSLRKNFAVADRKAHGLEHTRKSLNHDSELVTMLYAFADELDSLRK